MVLRILLRSLYTFPEFNKLPLLSINISLTFLKIHAQTRDLEKRSQHLPHNFTEFNFPEFHRDPWITEIHRLLLELSRDDNLKKMMALVRWYDAV